MSTRTLQFGKTIASTSFLMTHSVAEINYLYSLCYECTIVGFCNIHGKQRAKRTRSMLKTDIQNDTEIYYYTIAMNYLQKWTAQPFGSPLKLFIHPETAVILTYIFWWNNVYFDRSLSLSLFGLALGLVSFNFFPSLSLQCLNTFFIQIFYSVKFSIYSMESLNN